MGRIGRPRGREPAKKHGNRIPARFEIRRAFQMEILDGAQRQRIGLEDIGLSLQIDVGVQSIGGSLSAAHQAVEAHGVRGFFLHLHGARGLVAPRAKSAIKNAQRDEDDERSIDDFAPPAIDRKQITQGQFSFLEGLQRQTLSC